MTADDFRNWSIRYGAMFGMATEVDFQMFDAWYSVFDSCAYTIAELEKARLEIAKQPPKFRSEHLAAIHAAVHSVRREAERRVVARYTDPSEVGECVDCGNTGIVVVPHPLFVQGGVWVGHPQFGYRPTAGVLCHCERGRGALDRFRSLPEKARNGTPEPMVFERYKSLVPGWKQMLQKHEDEQLAVSRASLASRQADKMGGAIREVIQRAKEKMEP